MSTTEFTLITKIATLRIKSAYPAAVPEAPDMVLCWCSRHARCRADVLQCWSPARCRAARNRNKSRQRREYERRCCQRREQERKRVVVPPPDTPQKRDCRPHPSRWTQQTETFRRSTLPCHARRRRNGENSEVTQKRGGRFCVLLSRTRDRQGRKVLFNFSNGNCYGVFGNWWTESISCIMETKKLTPINPGGD